MDIGVGIYIAFKAGCYVAAFLAPIVFLVMVADWFSKRTHKKERPNE